MTIDTSTALPDLWPGGAVGAPRGTVIVSTMASDSHTWNLVYLQLLIEELGYRVVNLGPCVPDEQLVERCAEINPAMIVLSSVNGHGYQDGLRVVDKLRGCSRLAATPLVIGGKLGVHDAEAEVRAAALSAAGFDAVFEDGNRGAVTFQGFVESVDAASRQLDAAAEAVA